MHDRKRDLLWQTCIITEVYFLVVWTMKILAQLSSLIEEKPHSSISWSIPKDWTPGLTWSTEGRSHYASLAASWEIVCLNFFRTLWNSSSLNISWTHIMATLCLCTLTAAFKRLWDTLHVRYGCCKYGGRARVALGSWLFVLILLVLRYFTFHNAQA